MDSCFFAFLAFPLAAHAITIEVPGDAPTIGAAVEMAVNGDTVLLVSGFYSGPDNHSVSIIAKTLTIKSQNEDPQSCVIDAEGNPGFVFLGSSSNASLIGVTIVNAHAGDGGAVFANNQVTNIRNCIFTGNSATGSGGAIYIKDCRALIYDCVFESNTADGGGAISCTRQLNTLSPIINNCIFRNNVADFGGGLEIRNRSFPTVEYCTFTGNVANGVGGAVAMDFGIIQMDFCTLSGNSAGLGGAGIAGELPQGSTVSNTMIVNSVSGSAFYYWDEQGITFSCCNIYGNAGGDWIGGIEDQYPGVDNFSEDPQFCAGDPDSEEYWELQNDSPCGAGQSQCGQIGAWPIGCGSVGIQNMELGGVKAMFR